MSDATPAATVVPMMAPAPGGNAPVAAASIPPAPAAPVAPAPAAMATPAAEPVKTEPVVAAPHKRLISDDAVPATPAKPAEPAKPVVAADWKLEAPKGSLVSSHEVAALEAQAKKLGLPKEQAESFVAFRAEQIAAEVGRTNDAWYDQSMSDPEIGGDKMPVTQANVRKALAAFATPEERKAIANSPFANNPMFLRIMNRAAAGLPAEDKAIPSVQAGFTSYPTNPDEAAKAMYGKYNK